jgi:hypothetical protein
MLDQAMPPIAQHISGSGSTTSSRPLRDQRNG